jgi:uncharacterized membrane protein
MSDRARGARRVAIAAWVALGASVASWALPASSIGAVTTLVAGLPLLLPLPGLLGGGRRALRAAPMALAPALALAVTEYLANEDARPFAGATLALAFAAFAAILAALRATPPDQGT